uniref:Uncharacterized protein n=1 Tax=Spironucleus salmonicida TaxID=348837 RepID=V6LHS1_9EUKA|eukprot:EST43241.1 Hypothetical protein SS50377_ja026 [Spironucleus salmonicida]
MSLAVTFIPVDFTIFTSPRLQHYKQNLRAIRAKYVVKGAGAAAEDPPREPLTQEELQSLRLNERMIEKYPTTDLFLNQLQQDCETQIVFLCIGEDSRMVLSSTSFPHILISGPLLSSVVGKQLQNVDFQQILAILQPQKQTFWPVKFSKTSFQESQIDNDDGVVLENVNFTQVQGVKTVNSLEVLSQIVDVLLAQFPAKFQQFVYHFTAILVFHSKFEEIQNYAICVNFHTVCPQEIAQHFGIPHMDILDVRNSTLNTIFIKLNQRANSGDILQKVAEKSHIKPYLTKSYPANACDLLIPVASLDSEVPRRFCSQNRKLVQNEAVYHITNNIYQIEENKITVKEKVQYYYVQLVNSNQLAKLVSLKASCSLTPTRFPTRA